jgi:hypothetical protein
MARFREPFICSTAIILIVTATLKLVTVALAPRWANTEDPIFFFLSNRLLAGMAAILEFCIAWLLFTRTATKIKLTVIFWLSLFFACYHVGIRAMGTVDSCICLGDPQSWVTYFLRRDHFEEILVGIVIYMMTFSTWFLTGDGKVTNA